MRNRIFIASVFLLAGILCIAQEVTPEAELDYVIEEFTLPGGRLGNNVNSIVQGPYGFMWFGTHGGLHRYDGYEFVTFKADPKDTIAGSNNLSFSYIESLYWDRFDKLWVCTYGGGIFQFDPEKQIFSHYAHDPNNSTTVSHPRVLCAIEDAEGQLWFGTEKGLNRFDRRTGTFQQYFVDGKSGSLHNDDIRNMYVDKNGTLWLGTGIVYNTDGSFGALSRYDKEADTFHNYFYPSTGTDNTSSAAIRAIQEDKQSNFWVGTTHGLFKFDREQETFEKMAYNTNQAYAPGSADLGSIIPVFSILQDFDGGLWVGTIFNDIYPSHLLRYDPGHRQSQILPIIAHVWDMHQSKDGTIWTAGAGNSAKVFKIKPKPKTYDLLKGTHLVEELRNSKDFKKLIGKNKSQVFGPVNMGIDKKTGDYWLIYGVVIESELGTGSVEPKIFLVNHKAFNNRNRFYHLDKLDSRARDGARNWPVSGLQIDNQGRIWSSIPFSTVGLFCFDPSTSQLTQYLHDPDDPSTLSSNRIIEVLQDSRGMIWMGTLQGLNRLNPTTGEIKQFHFDTEDLGTGNGVWGIMEDREGKIWAGGNFASIDGYSFLAIIDSVNDSMTIKRLPGITQRIIFSLTQSPTTGIVGFAVNNLGVGAYFPDTDQFQFYNTSLGNLPFDIISNVICDQDGVFWLASGNDERYIRMEPGKRVFVFQGEKNLFHFVRAGFLGPNGHIYNLNTEGWEEIDPKLIVPDEADTDMKIQMVDLYVNGEKQIPGDRNKLPKPLWMTDQIELGQNELNFGFRFSEMNYQNKGTQFQYRLDPYESTWKNSGNTPLVSYFKVPPGKYQFQVQSAMDGGSGMANATTLEVIIHPPWWRKWWAFVLYGLILITGGLVVHRYQRARVIRAERERTRERELAQAKEIQKAYKKLKATQNQLIQSEKMASLGELTAGIAHEIQNPLNFVNNFSDVSHELLEEMDDEIEKGNLEEIKSLAGDVKQNLQKINYHGERASSIVKGMLDHSRSSTNKKEQININTLCDEYLRLAYHGFRAKENSFMADFNADLDPNIPAITAVPQDISRVLLNLINNAFYAVHAKKKDLNGDYDPLVTVRTTQQNGQVEITVTDNGNGIPMELIDKVFQPFFTTKPTGQGTGLGLSLSYDIVKAHDGEMKVISEEGEGTKFVVLLPVI